MAPQMGWGTRPGPLLGLPCYYLPPPPLVPCPNLAGASTRPTLPLKVRPRPHQPAPAATPPDSTGHTPPLLSVPGTASQPLFLANCYSSSEPLPAARGTARMPLPVCFCPSGLSEGRLLLPPLTKHP